MLCDVGQMESSVEVKTPISRQCPCHSATIMILTIPFPSSTTTTTTTTSLCNDFEEHPRLSPQSPQKALRKIANYAEAGSETVRQEGVCIISTLINTAIFSTRQRHSHDVHGYSPSIRSTIYCSRPAV